MKNANKLIFSTVMTLMLSGCAHMSSDFDCPMKNGVRCQSLDEVNAAVDSGDIGSRGASINIDRPSYNDVSLLQYKDVSTGKLTPVRYPEDVMRVWIAPYEDSSGNFHQASSVYTVTRSGDWIGEPPKEIRGE